MKIHKQLVTFRQTLRLGHCTVELNFVRYQPKLEAIGSCGIFDGRAKIFVAFYDKPLNDQLDMLTATLSHELMHCGIRTYGSILNNREFDGKSEEFICYLTQEIVTITHNVDWKTLNDILDGKL